MTLDIFLSASSKGWEELLEFPDPELHAESFGQKSLKKSYIQEACQNLKVIAEAISSHIISFRFQDTSE